MTKVEKISRIGIRDAFPIESKDFTPWLTENIDVLGDAIGLQLANAAREQSTGNFIVDIKAETSEGFGVVIENQYGNSDHDHLGKLITYLASFDAKVAIWIVEHPKQEHINAITWLNEGENNCQFYLLRVEAIRIGESPAAPLLSLIAGPSLESKQIGKFRKDNTENESLRSDFWKQLLERSQEIGIKQFTSLTSSGKNPWLGATAGKRGLTYKYWVNQKKNRIELNIDLGIDSDEENLNIFQNLKKYQKEIDEAFGDTLNWTELEGHRAFSIRFDIEGGYKSNPNDWAAIIEKQSVGMKRLINATEIYIKSLK